MMEIAREDGGETLLLNVEPKSLGTETILRTVLDKGGEIVGFNAVHRQLDEAFLDLTEPGVHE